MRKSEELVFLATVGSRYRSRNVLAVERTESASALREAVAENIHSRLSALELTGAIERPKRAERTVKPDIKKQRGQKAQDTKRDKALLAELYKTGRLRPAKEPALQSETLQRLLIVLQDQEREKFEPTLLRRLAALSRQARERRIHVQPQPFGLHPKQNGTDRTDREA
jgi:SOS-response transcriptional repressor LexA